MSGNSQEAPLPPKFHTVEASFAVEERKFVNIIGIVKDFQPPIRTRNIDSKCTIELVDPSIEDEYGTGIKVNYFAPEYYMPKSISVGDLIVLRQFKVQQKGGVSLLSNNSSELHILKASAVPRGPTASQDNIPWEKCGRPTKKVFNRPTAAEVAYAVWIHGRSDNLQLPSSEEFRTRAIQAMQPKDKFALLKDIPPDAPKPFYNIIGQVLRKHNGNGCQTIYFSDYTPNSHFYNRVKGDCADDSQDGQPWEGPWGKMSMQVSMFDLNAAYMTESIDVNNWVLLKNVKIERRDRQYIEGKLHTDGTKINVELLRAKDTNMDDRLRAALQRKLEHVQAQKKKLLGKGEGHDGKRKADGDVAEKPNSKKRRKEARAAAEKHAAEKDAKRQQKLNLNEYVCCIHPDQPIRSIADIKRQVYLRDNDNTEHPFPFTNNKSNALVRVVDYFPPRIEDFAQPHYPSEFDNLSVYSGEEDDNTGDSEWEWRFALQVEDTSMKPERMWLLVDHMSAQGLLNIEALERAENLRNNKGLLHTLREQLFKLWGDLEERKSATLPQEDIPPSTMDSSTTISPIRKPIVQPNADESDDEYLAAVPKPAVLEEISSNIRPQIDEKSTNNVKDDTKQNTKAKNKPFICSIRQYGVKVPEKEVQKADAGKGKRWQRVFGLFETTIV